MIFPYEFVSNTIELVLPDGHVCRCGSGLILALASVYLIRICQPVQSGPILYGQVFRRPTDCCLADNYSLPQLVIRLLCHTVPNQTPWYVAAISKEGVRSL
jgi:hypothetical protein